MVSRRGRPTDIATYGPNQPRGRFSENLREHSLPIYSVEELTKVATFTASPGFIIMLDPDKLYSAKSLNIITNLCTEAIS